MIRVLSLLLIIYTAKRRLTQEKKVFTLCSLFVLCSRFVHGLFLSKQNEGRTKRERLAPAGTNREQIGNKSRTKRERKKSLV
jgi:hypothetical protein